MTNPPIKIAVLKGDGIGPEVVESAVEVLRATAGKNSLPLELVPLLIGFEAYREKGRTLPPETLEEMKKCDGWILGPLQAGSYPKDDKDYPMASGKIRKAFFSFKWEGSELAKEFGKTEPPMEKFMPITYQKDWQVVREVDAAMAVRYECK